MKEEKDYLKEWYETGETGSAEVVISKMPDEFKRKFRQSMDGETCPNSDQFNNTPDYSQEPESGQEQEPEQEPETEPEQEPEADIKSEPSGDFRNEALSKTSALLNTLLNMDKMSSSEREIKKDQLKTIVSELQNLFGER